jgi:hypothetical protein
MSEDSPLPPNGADPDDADVDADIDADDVDPEEAAAASALAQALEGRSATARVPDSALETAALLRYSGAAAELSDERRAVLRQQVLASLPATSTRTRSSQTSSTRSALWRWLGIGMPLAGAAAAVWLVVGAFQHAAEPELARRADERAASATATARDEAEGSAAENSEAKSEAKSEENAEPEPEADEDEAAPSGALARRRAASNEDRAPMAKAAPGALASPSAAAPSAAAPSAPSAAGPALRAEASRVEASRAENSDSRGSGSIGSGSIGSDSMGPGAVGSIGSGAGLGAAEAKRGGAPSAPSSERLQRSSQRFRARLLPRLADPRVDQTYAELDRAQTNADLRQAQTHLTALSSGPLGSNGNTSGKTSDADLLRQDIYCRLAEVALRLGQAKVALDWARRGLELPAPPNPFAARLWHVQGQARAALGDQDGAARSYMKAIEVNERLLDESLDGAE